MCVLSRRSALVVSLPFLYFAQAYSCLCWLQKRTLREIGLLPAYRSRIPGTPVCSSDSQYVYVASNNSDFTQGEIIVISVATHEVISQFAAGAQALGLAISPDGQTLYSCDDNSNIQVISTANHTVTATINLNVPVITAFSPILTLSPDGTSLWVATFSRATQAIYVINTAAPRNR